MTTLLEGLRLVAAGKSLIDACGVERAFDIRETLVESGHARYVSTWPYVELTEQGAEALRPPGKPPWSYRCGFCGRVGDAASPFPAYPFNAPLCSERCAWRYCARATDGAHTKDSDGNCMSCGKPAAAPKHDLGSS